VADLSGIDRIFDLIDGGVDTVSGIVNGTKRVADKLEDEKPKAKAPSTAKAKAPPASSSPALPPVMSDSKAIATRRTRYRIEETTDASSGAVLFVVTDGKAARCEFTSRAMAEQIWQKLESLS
jgi:hypothetical protein